MENMDGLKGKKNEEQLRSLIADEEGVKDENYRLLGKAYMNMHPQISQEMLMDYIQRIQDADKKIRSYQREIMIIKGITFCEKCDTELPENALFCGCCGYRISKPIIRMSENQERCIKCGYIYQKGIKFCINCGSKIESGTLTEDILSEVTGVRCVKCGKELEEGALFCTECGAKQ